LQLPLSRLSLSEIRREVITQGLVAEISGATLWRWLSADALRPWRHRSWIFPRDPDFAAKAGRILDLYDRVWQWRALNAREFVISADEVSSCPASGATTVARASDARSRHPFSSTNPKARLQSNSGERADSSDCKLLR